MTALRVLDVAGLGYEAAVMHMDDGKSLLFLDAGLEHDERMNLLTRAMGQVLE